MFAGSIQAYATGLSLGISLIVAIGAQNAFVLRQGLARSHVRLVVAVCVLLDAILMTVGVSGVASALGRTPWALDGVAIGGAGFLAGYGLAAAQRARAGTSAFVLASAGPRSAPQALAQTLAVSLLNPHVYLDTVLLVGSVGAQQPSALRMAFLAGSCSASLGWFASLGFGARMLAPLFARPHAWRVLDVLVALVMWSVAVTLLLKLLRG
jgi:L-lysine exporter family protein LysE/ArgO